MRTITNAKTVNELRCAQAIFLPLELGLSLEQTARVIGRSINVVYKLLNCKRREAVGEIMPPSLKKPLEKRLRSSHYIAF